MKPNKNLALLALLFVLSTLMTAVCLAESAPTEDVNEDVQRCHYVEEI